jgi:hypothetical protein
MTAPAAASPPAPRKPDLFSRLPDELKVEIFRFAGCRDLARMRGTCQALRALINESSFFDRLDRFQYLFSKRREVTPFAEVPLRFEDYFELATYVFRYRNPCDILMASSSLADVEPVVEAAIRRMSMAIQFASSRLQRDPKMIDLSLRSMRRQLAPVPA